MRVITVGRAAFFFLAWEFFEGVLEVGRSERSFSKRCGKVGFSTGRSCSTEWGAE